MSRFEDQNRALGNELLNRAGIAQDAGWEESKHPRAENGQFGSGGGGSTGSGEAKPEPEGLKALNEVFKAPPQSEKQPITQHSLKARVRAQMDNIHKALGPEKYEVVRKAAYEKNPSPAQLEQAEHLMAEAGYGERREPGAVLPKKPMSEAQKKSNAKAMSSAAATAANRAGLATRDIAKRFYNEASTALAEAAQHYAKGDYEAGQRAESKGFHAQFRAEANDH